MNIKQTLETLKTEGFEITTYPRPWRRYEARKKDDNGDGVVLWLRFDKRARKGRPLVSADLSVFPLFDGNRRVLNGAKGRELKEAKALSLLLPCAVKTCGCTLETFIDGKRQQKEKTK